MPTTISQATKTSQSIAVHLPRLIYKRGKTAGNHDHHPANQSHTACKHFLANPKQRWLLGGKTEIAARGWESQRGINCIDSQAF